MSQPTPGDDLDILTQNAADCFGWHPDAEVIHGVLTEGNTNSQSQHTPSTHDGWMDQCMHACMHTVDSGTIMQSLTPHIKGHAQVDFAV